MQNGHHFYPDANQPPPEYQGGNNYMNFPGASSFGADVHHGAKHMKQFPGIEFQPSEVCPKNFIIFDQTDHRSQVMFHPAIAHRFNGPGLNMGAAYAPDNFVGGYRNNDVGLVSSPLKEDSDDIDALLSMEDEDEQEYDEEEVSTARTYGNYGSASPESCSNYGAKTRKNGSSSSNRRSSGSAAASSNCNDETKRRKMKKMMRALRGIVPGGNDMNTATVLDEAVQYLKSLKVEVQKLGVGNLDD